MNGFGMPGVTSRNRMLAQILAQQARSSNNGSHLGGLAYALQQGLAGYLTGKDGRDQTAAAQAMAQVTVTALVRSMAIGTAQERCPPPRRARAPRRRPQRDWKRLRLHPTICPGRSAGLGRSCQPEPPLAPAQARPCPQKCTVARLFRHPHHCCCCYCQTPSSQKHCRRSGRQEGSQASPSSAPVVANRAPSCAVPGPREGGYNQPHLAPAASQRSC